MLFVFQDGRAVSPLNASEPFGFVFECVAVSGCGEEEEGALGVPLPSTGERVLLRIPGEACAFSGAGGAFSRLAGALGGSLRHGQVCGFLGMGILPPVVAGVVSLAGPGAAAACAAVR